MIRSVSRRQDAIEVARGLDGAAARQGKPSRFVVLSFLWHLLAGGVVGIIVPLYDRSVRRYARGIFGVPGSSRKPPDSPNSPIQELSMLRDRVRTSEMLHFVMGAVQIALGCWYSELRLRLVLKYLPKGSSVLRGTKNREMMTSRETIFVFGGVVIIIGICNLAIALWRRQDVSMCMEDNVDPLKWCSRMEAPAFPAAFTAVLFLPLGFLINRLMRSCPGELVYGLPTVVSTLIVLADDLTLRRFIRRSREAISKYPDRESPGKSGGLYIPTDLQPRAAQSPSRDGMYRNTDPGQ